MSYNIKFDLKLETERLFLIAGERVYTYKDTIKDGMLNSVVRLKNGFHFLIIILTILKLQILLIKLPMLT